MMCNLSSDISDSQNKLLCFSITFCEWTLCRRTVFKKTITSNHHGFAGVDLAGAIYLTMNDSLIGAGIFLR